MLFKDKLILFFFVVVVVTLTLLLSWKPLYNKGYRDGQAATAPVPAPRPDDNLKEIKGLLMELKLLKEAELRLLDRAVKEHIVVRLPD